MVFHCMRATAPRMRCEFVLSIFRHWICSAKCKIVEDRHVRRLIADMTGHRPRSRTWHSKRPEQKDARARHDMNTHSFQFVPSSGRIDSSYAANVAVRRRRGRGVRITCGQQAQVSGCQISFFQSVGVVETFACLLCRRSQPSFVCCSMTQQQGVITAGVI